MPDDVWAHCPVCDGRNLEQLAVDITFAAQGTLRVILTCQHCGATWRGRYRLTGYDHIERLGQAYPDVGGGDAEAEESSDA